jgi:hypothetical protein
MTPAAAAQARADEAREHRIHCEEALVDARVPYGIPAEVIDLPMVHLMRARSVEFIIEGGNLEFSRVYSAVRRAQSAERKAISAALRAKISPAAATPAPAPALSCASPMYHHRLAEYLVARRTEARAAA